VWKRDGKVIFNQYGNEGKSQGSLLEETGEGRWYGDFYNREIVDSIDLLNFIKLFNEKEVYIVMDIEYSEYDLLEHMINNGWSKNINKIWIKWHGTNDEKISIKAKELESKIKSLGVKLDTV
jgi:hypothetical protein